MLSGVGGRVGRETSGKPRSFGRGLREACLKLIKTTLGIISRKAVPTSGVMREGALTTAYGPASGSLRMRGQRPPEKLPKILLCPPGLRGGSGRGLRRFVPPSFPVTPLSGPTPGSSGPASSEVGCCPRGTPWSRRAVGTAPCRLGVPEFCGSVSCGRKRPAGAQLSS